jgi:hypothetical protein
VGSELFRVDERNVDIKTELSHESVRYVNVLMVNDAHLRSVGITPVYAAYYKEFLRLMISLERKGRGEYVEINKRDNTDETLNRLGTFGNIMSAKGIK